jgi:hypothetical protein
MTSKPALQIKEILYTEEEDKHENQVKINLFKEKRRKNENVERI